jgi:dienelactone hydrolase
MPIQPFVLPQPTDLHEWEARRVQIRSALYHQLGDLPPIFTPRADILKTEQRDGFRVEKIAFANGLDDTVYGYVLVPDQPNGAAVQYCHYHGGIYGLGKDEILGDPLWDEQWAGKTPRGVTLAQAGYLVLAIDAYAFGDRQNQGPAGERESGRDTENSLFKRFLWEGTSLWSMIFYDDLLALNYLLTRPEIDPARVAVTGASLGASRTTWLAAMDDRIKIAIPVSQLTRYQNLIGTGELNQHSIYYYVPGVLKAGLDMEALVALVAPRLQLILAGGSDALSPPEGIPIITDFARAVYRLYGAEENFQPRIYPELGHVYTTEMFATLLDFLEQHL